MRVLDFNKHSDGFPIAMNADNHSTVSEHKHSFFEFVYVCRGKAEHIFDHRSMIVEEGDFFLVDLGTSHEYRPIGSTDALRVINCLFLPQFLDESFTDVTSFCDILDKFLPRYGYSRFGEAPTQRIFHDESGIVGTLMEHMLREFQEKRSGYMDVLQNLLLTLLIQLVRNEASEENRPTTRIIRDIREYVSKSYSRPLSLSEICGELHFSLPYVSAVFRRETGMTFRTYLARVRIEKACQLLRLSELTIAQIASRIGYADPAFFYKSFHREMEMTPDEYRRKYRV